MRERYTFFEWEPSTTKQDKVAQIAASGKRTLIIDLLAYTQPEEQTKDPVQLAIERTQKRLRLAQTLAPIKEQIQWLSVVPYGPEDRSAYALLLAGTTAGSTKSLAHEWGIWGRTVFADPQALPKSWLLDEIEDSCQYSEIYYRAHTRLTTRLVEREPAEALQLPERPVLAISGGGLGITARISSALRQHIGPYRALIMGRTSLPDPHDPIPVDEPARAKKKLRSQMKPDATAREVQAAFQKAKKQAALQKQLEALRAEGIEVLYVPTDIQELSAVQNATQIAIERWGAIHGVIHGAGVDFSRSIEQKSTEELEFVLKVKLLGLQNIQKALEQESIAFWMAFGSVSARFGNTGQFDYAAANDALAQWMTRSALFSNALVVDYSAWEEVGMAASLASLMKERGVDTLPLSLATQATTRLLCTGQTGEWVLSGRLPTSFSNDAWLGTVTQHIPGEKLVYTTQLSSGTYRYLSDHTIQDAEVMPGVASLHSLRRTARRIAWQSQLTEARSVSFGKAVKIWSGRAVNVERTVEANASVGSYTTELYSTRERKGKQERLQHVSAEFRTGPRSDLPPQLVQLHNQSIQVKTAPLEAQKIYQSFFHGPAWQVIEMSILTQKMGYSTSPVLQAPLGGELPKEERWDAVALELIFQTAGLWTEHIEKQFALPFGIERCVWVHAPQPGESIEARIQPTGRVEDVYQFDGIVYSSSHQPILWVEGLQLRLFPLGDRV